MLPFPGPPSPVAGPPPSSFAPPLLPSSLPGPLTLLSSVRSGTGRAMPLGASQDGWASPADSRAFHGRPLQLF
eukprot:15126548-Alexandrium_andersonii.AAC.1